MKYPKWLKYITKRTGSNVGNDISNVPSDCTEINFVNLGTAVATVVYEGITQTLNQYDEFSCGGDHADTWETTEFNITFGAGTKNLLIERVYKEPICQA